MTNPRWQPPWLLVLIGLAGLAVGALSVGAVWLTAGPQVVDRRPIAAPPNIGDYVPLFQAKLDPDLRTDLIDRMRENNRRSSELLSQAHGGAGALVEFYSSQDVRKQFTLLVYRGPSPHPLYAPYQDPDWDGEPMRTVQEFGEVSCMVYNDPDPTGKPSAERASHASQCARTNGALTVELQPTGDLGEDPASIASLVDKAWDQVLH
ncbi:hypothetical protein ACFQ1S_20805 [Kibdelosporangium lantanae]|uniref:DUF3105 domain-containing protein n=1 Tax=Kibdelosporangium lantanae TaxID=1497396 RepID=A0ABW3MBY0_9PSEU